MRQSHYGDLLDALHGVTWPARRVVRGASAGAHRSPMPGVSPEFTEYRPYRQGDETRRLDWKLLARTDRAYLRITSDRATLGTLLVVDASASMAFPADASGGFGKWTQAKRLAVGLASVALAAADPVGLVVVAGRGTIELGARTRRGMLAEVSRVLDAVTPNGSAPVAPAIGPSRRAKRIVVISDFLGDADEVLRAARLCQSGGGEAFAIHIVAREEMEPHANGTVAIDPEDPRLKRPILRATRDAYDAAFATFRERVKTQWSDAGAGYALVTAHEASDRAIRRITLGIGVNRSSA